jgi:hypothetical protein
VHLKKDVEPRLLVDDGMQIDERNEQEENAERPSNDNLHPDSNATVESFAHPEKHFAPMFSTEQGMRIDGSDTRHENATSPNSESLDSDSNVTDRKTAASEEAFRTNHFDRARTANPRKR